MTVRTGHHPGTVVPPGIPFGSTFGGPARRATRPYWVLNSGFLEYVWIVGRHALERLGRTYSRNCAVVTVDATVVSHLQVQRAVAEKLASLDAFSATDTKFFRDQIFIKGVFHKTSLDGPGGAELIFGGGIGLPCLGSMEPAAQLAVSADIIGVDALDSGRHEHAGSCAPAALDTLLRVQLPGMTDGGSLAARRLQANSAQRQCRCGPQNVFPELPPIAGAGIYF